MLLGILLGGLAWWTSRTIARAPVVSVKTTASPGGGVEGLPPIEPQVGPGSLRLLGSVVDSAGIPVVGVTVRAERTDELSSPPSAPPSASPPPPSAPSPSAPSPSAPAPSAPAPSAPLSPAPPRPSSAPVVLLSATDRDGRFELRGAEPGLYTLRVSGAGIFAAELLAIPIPGLDPDAPLPIVVARKVSIAGLVTERGQPVAGATVEITSDAIGGTVQQTTSPAGTFSLPELPEGTYDVVAYRGDLASATAHLTRLGAGPFSPITLPLDTAALVIGRVFERVPGDPSGGPGVVAALELRPLSDDEPARYAQSGADGRFRVEGVHLGRWVVSAIAPGYVTPEPVEFDAGRGVIELGVLAGGSIEGRVVDSAGKPIAGAELRALTAAGQELSGDRDDALLASFGGRTVAAAAAWDADLAARQDPRFVPRGELGVLLGPIPPIPPLGARAARHAVLDLAALPPELASLTRPPTFAVAPSAASQWQTGADGRFTLRALPPGRFTLRARAPGFAEGQRGTLAVAAGAVVRNVEIVLSVGTFLVGTVRNQRGEPVVGARLRAYPVGLGAAAGLAAPSASASSAPASAARRNTLALDAESNPDVLEVRTSGDGSYRLGPVVGAVQLEASADGHATVVRRADTGVVAGSLPGERREDLVLTVYEAVLRGVAEDARGAAVANARVIIAQGPAQGRSTSTGADGSFTLSQLPAGALRIRVEHPELPPFLTTVDVAAPARLALPFGGAIAGRLLDDAGNPAGGVRFIASGPSGPAGAGSDVAATELTSARDGTWRLDALRPGPWQITVRRPGFLPLIRTFNVPAATLRGELTVRDVVLTLARGGTVAGTIRDGRGRRLADALVTARSSDGTTAETRSDANGEFRLRDCPTGDLELFAEHSGARASTRFFLRPGQEISTLVLEVPTP